MTYVDFACVGRGMPGRDDRLLPADLQHGPRPVQGPVRLPRQHDRRHHTASYHGPERWVIE